MTRDISGSKILVIGGAGLVGSHLVDLLVDEMGADQTGPADDEDLAARDVAGHADSFVLFWG